MKVFIVVYINKQSVFVIVYLFESGFKLLSFFQVIYKNGNFDFVL
jgi:hypothetical protein